MTVPTTITPLITAGLDLAGVLGASGALNAPPNPPDYSTNTNVSGVSPFSISIGGLAGDAMATSDGGGQGVAGPGGAVTTGSGETFTSKVIFAVSVALVTALVIKAVK